MHPNPRAETSKPLLPNVRFFIDSPYETRLFVFEGAERLTTVPRNSVGFLNAGGTCRFLRFSPILRGHALPGTEGSREGVGILVAEKIGSLCQFQHRVGEVIACHLMTRLIQYALVVRAGILQPPLQGTWAHVEVFGNVPCSGGCRIPGFGR